MDDNEQTKLIGWDEANKQEPNKNGKDTRQPV